MKTGRLTFILAAVSLMLPCREVFDPSLARHMLVQSVELSQAPDAPGEPSPGQPSPGQPSPGRLLDQTPRPAPQAERTPQPEEAQQTEPPAPMPENTPSPEPDDPERSETPAPEPEDTQTPEPNDPERSETPAPEPEDTPTPTPDEAQQTETPAPEPEGTPTPEPDAPEQTETPAPEDVPEPVAAPTGDGVPGDGWPGDGSQEDGAPRKATYTVVYRMENADYENPYLDEAARDRERYADWDAETFEGAAGDLTAIVPPEIPGFTARVEQQTVKEDGSTVVYVVYDRNVYTLTFRDRTDTRTVYTLTAKYGAQLDYHWPYADAWSGATDWLLAPDDAGARQTRLAAMPLGDRTYYQPSYNERTATSDYYVELLPGEEGGEDVVELGGKRYRKARSNTCSAVGENASSVGEEDFYEIPGYEANRALSAQTGDAYGGASFYYNRREYAVVLSAGGVKQRVKMRYGDDLTGLLDRDPPGGAVQTLPDGSRRVFEGWYATADCSGEPLTLDGARMPARDFVVYAKWRVEPAETPAPEPTPVLPSERGGNTPARTPESAEDTPSPERAENTPEPSSAQKEDAPAARTGGCCAGGCCACCRR